MFASFFCRGLRTIVSLHNTAVNYSILNGGRLLLLHDERFFKPDIGLFRNYWRFQTPIDEITSKCRFKQDHAVLF
ncbi:MAG: hypothetical protein A2Z38_07985 [Planctomycetes bacterium RBG_19FT_COMBO_48_8]|nr:MAG: hypothetical protein A2Z38_07985 [Planctomycetes bacterium RBG_19FT_COMBO_48_8]